MIFQNYNLVYSLSVLQNVLHGCLGYMSGIRGILGMYTESDKLRAFALLKELGMEQFCYNRASDLSGGQKQRVEDRAGRHAAAEAASVRRADRFLDPSSAKTIMDLLKDMAKKRNIACIVNLHQLDVALAYSTRIIGLSKGEVVFDGPPELLTDGIIERIYGTSKENLMIGGGNEKRDIVDCA